MTIEEKISDGIKNAMKSKDKVKLEALRNVKKYIIEAKTSGSNGGEINDAECLKIIQKLAKQGTDSATIYKDQNRMDLYDYEIAQVEALKEYLPSQMSDTELDIAIKNIIASVGAASVKEMGKVMGVASKQLAGKADGKAISDKVKELLS